jgi:hypothetical protein
MLLFAHVYFFNAEDMSALSDLALVRAGRVAPQLAIERMDGLLRAADAFFVDRLRRRRESEVS